MWGGHTKATAEEPTKKKKNPVTISPTQGCNGREGVCNSPQALSPTAMNWTLWRGRAEPLQKTSLKLCFHNQKYNFPPQLSVQSLSHVRLFANPWIAARQASLSITNSRSSLRLTSIKSVMPSSHLISSVVPFSSCPQSLPASESFPVSQLFAWGDQSTGVSVSPTLNISKNGSPLSHSVPY